MELIYRSIFGKSPYKGELPVLFFCAWSSHSFSSPPPSCHFHLSSFLLFFSHLVFPCRCSHALTTSSEKPQLQPRPHTHTHIHTHTHPHNKGNVLFLFSICGCSFGWHFVTNKVNNVQEISFLKYLPWQY